MDPPPPSLWRDKLRRNASRNLTQRHKSTKEDGPIAGPNPETSGKIRLNEIDTDEIFGWVSLAVAVEFVAMIADVKRLLEAQPFEAFSIVTTSGKQYDVPSPDHAGISPQAGRIIIWFDDDSSVTLSGLHITAIEKSTTDGRK